MRPRQRESATDHSRQKRTMKVWWGTHNNGIGDK
jgi:hypothetical protein